MKCTKLFQELESIIAHLEEERRQVVDVVDSRTWITEVGHSEEADDESSISEQARRLDHAVERNISLGSDLYVNSDLSGDISEPLAVTSSLKLTSSWEKSR